MISRHSANRTERLDYMRSMLVQLRTMADADGHQMLAYLMEMAQLEAGDVARQIEPAPDRTLKRNNLA